jgi:hypothetical protein
VNTGGHFLFRRYYKQKDRVTPYFLAYNSAGIWTGYRLRGIRRCAGFGGVVKQDGAFGIRAGFDALDIGDHQQLGEGLG